MDLSAAIRRTLLRFIHRVVGILQQFGDDRLDVLSHVPSLSERGAVTDGEGDVQTARQRLRQQCLACTGQSGDVVRDRLPGRS